MTPKTPAPPSLDSLLLQMMAYLQHQQELKNQPAEDQPTAEDPQTFTVFEVAKYLKVSNWTIYDMVRTKSIPHFSIRSRKFFRRREIDQWIASQDSFRLKKAGG